MFHYGSSKLALNIWLSAATVTMFVANARVMAGRFSGKIVQKHNIQPSRYTAVQVTDISFDYWQ